MFKTRTLEDVKRKLKNQSKICLFTGLCIGITSLLLYQNADNIEQYLGVLLFGGITVLFIYGYIYAKYIIREIERNNFLYLEDEVVEIIRKDNVSSSHSHMSSVKLKNREKAVKIEKEILYQVKIGSIARYIEVKNWVYVTGVVNKRNM